MTHTTVPTGISGNLSGMSGKCQGIFCGTLVGTLLTLHITIWFRIREHLSALQQSVIVSYFSKTFVVTEPMHIDQKNEWPAVTLPCVGWCDILPDWDEWVAVKKREQTVKF